jgi:biotin synthase
MMGRWGLQGMQSFEQAGLARKEGARLDVRAQSEAPLTPE